MPTISIPLPDISQSVFRPIVIDIAQQIKEWTKIDPSVPIFFGNDSGQLQSAGSGLDNKEDRLMRSDTTQRINIRAEETFAEDQQITDITGRRGNNPVFVDPALNAWMAPSSISSRVLIDFEYRTRSKEDARKWRDSLNARYLQGRQAIQHQITYSYSLPQPAWEIIYELHRKREAIGGYGEDINDYMRNCITDRMTIISNETGSQIQYTIAERQDRIQGFFEFSNEIPKPEYDDATGMWVVAFQYRFVYQRPSMMDCRYPIIVHQQLLEAPFIEFVNKKIIPDERELKRSQWLWGLQQFEKNTLMQHLKPKSPYIRIPMQDDFRLNYIFPGTSTFLLVLLQQTQAEEFAFNLRELGDVVIDEDILNFIANGEYQYIGRMGKSIFHFDLYRGDQICQNPAIRIDKDLNVFLNTPIDVRKEYRIRMAVFTDFSFIDRGALDRLMEDSVACMKVLGAINELLYYDADFRKLGSQRKIHPWQMSKLYEAVMGQGTCNIYSGPSVSYGAGAWGTNWTNDQRTFMTDIPERILNAYRASRRTKKDQQIFGIVSFNKDRVKEFKKKG